MDVIILVARFLLAAVFALAGIAKLADGAGSRKAMRDFGIPESFAGLDAVVLPVAEIVVAVALIPDATAWWGALGAGVLLLLFVGGIARSMARGETPDCHCFGQIHSEPAGWRTLLRNVVLLTIAGLVISQGPSDAGWSALHRLTHLADAEWVSLSIGLVLLGTAAVLGWFMRRLLQEVTRLADRMEVLETRTMRAAQETSVDEKVSEPESAGLPAPTFSLSGLAGNTVTLDTLLAAGKPLFLIFASADCGPCTEALTQATRWQAEHGSTISVVPIIEGEAAAVAGKAAQLELTNVLLHDTEVARQYGVQTLPSAVVVRAGRLMGEVAVGPEAISELYSTALHVLSSPAPREADAAGPAPSRASAATAGGRDETVFPGTVPMPAEILASDPSANGHGKAVPDLFGEETEAPMTPNEIQEAVIPLAPVFALTGLDGQIITLDDLRAAGKPILLVFADAGCGPCTVALTEAGRWQAEHESPISVVPLILGSAEAAQTKAMTLGLTNVLLQDFQVASAYGASMPSAVLINPDGTLGSAVAAGPDAIRALFEETAGISAPAGPSPAQAPAGAGHVESPPPAAHAADINLMLPLKRSREYQAIQPRMADPDLIDSWQEDGLHFFVFQLLGADNTDGSERSTAVFVMQHGADDPVSAVVVAPSNAQEPDVIDLRREDELDRLMSTVA